MDNSASIAVLNYPTYVTIAILLNIKQSDTLNSVKTRIVANQTEVPILLYVTVALNTTIEDDYRQFTILFAVADKNYNFLGTHFFEEYIQNIKIQDFTLHFIYCRRLMGALDLLCKRKKENEDAAQKINLL